VEVLLHLLHHRRTLSVRAHRHFGRCGLCIGQFASHAAAPPHNLPVLLRQPVSRQTDGRRPMGSPGRRQLPSPTQPEVALPGTKLHIPHSALSSLQPPRSGVLKMAYHMGCAWCGMCMDSSMQFGAACGLVAGYSVV